MTKRVSRRTHQQELMGMWWLRAILALTFLLLAYGFASLAIDSAHLWEYALAVVFIWYGVRNVIQAVRFGFFD